MLPSSDLLPIEEIEDRLDRVLASSPADETELTWIEVRRLRESTRKRDSHEARERSLLIRVRERGRSGFHRTGFAEIGDLENAVRQALAQARLSAPSPPVQAGPGTLAALPDCGPLFDEELSRLSPGRARDLLQRAAHKDGREWAELRCEEGWVAVARSSGTACSARVTAAALRVVSGSGGPGAGHAAAAARSLAALDLPEVFERARRRAAPAVASALPAGPLPPLALMLAPEAAAALVALLHRQALSASSWEEERSFLRGRAGEAALSPCLHLCDDGTDPGGLPFPFDLRGRPHWRAELVRAGVLVAPTAEAGNLFLLPGTEDDAELARRAGDPALWIGALEAIEALPLGSGFRAVARGVRTLDGGIPGPGLPDLIWEDDLADLFRRVIGVGRRPVRVAGDDLLLGGVSAPCLLVGPAAGTFRLTPAASTP